MPPRSDPSEPTISDEISRVLLLEGHRKTYIADHIRALIRIYGLAGMKSDGMVGLMFDILFIDNTTTDHFGKFQEFWPEYRPSDDLDNPEHREW